MSCSSLPVATAPYFVRAPSSLIDWMFVFGKSEVGSWRALVEHGAACGDEPAELVVLGFGGREVPLRFGDTLPARSGTRARRRCTARRARRSCRRSRRSRLGAARPAPSCRRSSRPLARSGPSAPSINVAATTTTGRRNELRVTNTAPFGEQEARGAKHRDRWGATSARVDRTRSA